MRGGIRDNTKKLWGFISIVAPSKKYKWISRFFKKRLFWKDSKSGDNDNNKNIAMIKTIMIMITAIIIMIIVVMTNS